MTDQEQVRPSVRATVPGSPNSLAGWFAHPRRLGGRLDARRCPDCHTDAERAIASHAGSKL